MITSVEDAPTFNASTTSIDIGNGIMVDPSCNSTITLSCLMQLYNLRLKETDLLVSLVTSKSLYGVLSRPSREFH